MRLLADTNIVSQVVRALRAAKHDVLYIAERAVDPGDEEILEEAWGDSRVLITKDHDLGALVFREGRPHAGILVIDDLGDPAEECGLIAEVLDRAHEALVRGAFVRAGADFVRIARPGERPERD